MAPPRSTADLIDLAVDPTTALGTITVITAAALAAWGTTSGVKTSRHWS